MLNGGTEAEGTSEDEQGHERRWELRWEMGAEVDSSQLNSQISLLLQAFVACTSLGKG